MDRNNEYQREGQDITASDMIQFEENSEIVDSFKGSSFFITGATGFLGKLAIEKLLRVCPDVKQIFILIRAKKGKDVKQRFDEIFNEISFDSLRRNNPNFQEKVYPIIGDMSLPDMGIDEIDREKLIQEVDYVLHFAATVRFDEKLRLATYINVRGVQDILRLAKLMKNLRAFLHVSTAFSNCIRKDIGEMFYAPPISGKNLLNLVECLDDDQLEAITKTILNGFPNTYAFTKCVAEDILKTEGKNLPIALFRPSIVIATVKEPVCGWIDNVYGATGVLIGAAIGLLRILYGKKENNAEMVPADYVINSGLAVVWDLARTKSLNNNREIDGTLDQEIPVYNYVSTPENPMSWDQFYKYSVKHGEKIVTEKIVWYRMFFMISNYYMHLIAVFFLHTIPAHLVDIILVCVGKKPMLVKAYKKINKFADVLGYFTINEWIFKNDNIQDLWKKLNNRDKELFAFDLKTLSWDSYFYTYMRGARVYLLKDPLDTVPQGRIKFFRLMIAHYALLGVIFILIMRLFYSLGAALWRI